MLQSMHLVVPWDRVALGLQIPADLLDRVEAEREPAQLKAVSLRKLLSVAKIERAGERRLRRRALVKRAGC